MDSEIHEMGTVLPEQLQVDCSHGEVLAYEHDDELLASCRLCGKTMKLSEWLESKNAPLCGCGNDCGNY